MLLSPFTCSQTSTDPSCQLTRPDFPVLHFVQQMNLSGEIFGQLGDAFTALGFRRHGDSMPVFTNTSIINSVSDASNLPSRYLKPLPGDRDGDGLPAIAGGKVEFEVTGRFRILVSLIWKGEIYAGMLLIDPLTHALWKLQSRLH